MTIEIRRGRQFNGPDTQVRTLFDSRGQLGAWLPAAAKKLVEQDVTVTLKGSSGEVTLKTDAEWEKFLKDNASSTSKTQSFANSFGITFSDFVEMVDDVAASDAKGVALDLSPTSELAKALKLDSIDQNYADGLKTGDKVELSGQTESFVAGAPNAIGPDILATPIPGATWERDRAEQESWADFQLTDGAKGIFKENVGFEAFTGLTDPKWDDEKAMALVDSFSMPIRLEQVTADDGSGTKEFQDKNEMFRETYYDDRNGTLSKSDASVRARVRFDDDPPYTVRRVLVQAKEGREIDDNGNSSVRKFERRWEGDRVDEKAAQSALVSGYEDGKPMAVSQKLYTVAKEAGNLPDDGMLRLEPKTVVLQKRRRTHLFLENVSELRTRRDALKKQIDDAKAAGTTVDPRQQKYLETLDGQVTKLEESSALLKKYGQYMPSGECIILSADRYNVYDAQARADQPNDLDDEVGLIGEGLHVEAEWDSASSDPFEKALVKIEEQLKTNPSNADELKKDAEAIEAIRMTFRGDVATVVKMMQERLVDAGLELDGSKKSKEERASEFLSQVTSRPTYWL